MNPTNNINSVFSSLKAAPNLGQNSSVAPASGFSSNLSDSVLSTVVEIHSGLQSVIASNPANPNLNISSPLQNLAQLHLEEYEEKLIFDDQNNLSISLSSGSNMSVPNMNDEPPKYASTFEAKTITIIQKAKENSPQDIVKALQDRNDPAAKHKLAHINMKGLYNTTVSNRNALTCLRLSAQANHPPALYDYGVAYEYGSLGLAKSPSEAFRLYRLAAEQGHSDAQYYLAYAYELGLEESPSEALRLYQLAAEQGHSAALFSLAFAYEYGWLGLEESPGEALRLYRIAADKGHSAAQYRLAQAYEDGWLGLEKSLSKALRLFHITADQRFPAALFRLAQAYEDGELGLDNNLEHAEHYYIEAANLGYASAQYNRLANAYCDGSLGENKIDHSKALQYLIKHHCLRSTIPVDGTNFVQMAVLARDVEKGGSWNLGLTCTWAIRFTY